MRLTKVLAAVIVLTAGFAHAQEGADKPNILAIMGDDIGWYNTSAYNDGIMG